MRGFLHDVRLALRGLKARPGFALVAVSTMALGIATASAIWSVVDAVLVRPLPFSEPGRLVFVWGHQLVRQRDRNVVGPANLVAWRERSRSFSGLAGFIRFDANLDGSGEPERIPVGFTTGNLFSVLGTRAGLLQTLPHHRAGRVKILGVGHKQRLKAHPDIPAISETVPGYYNTGWWGIVAPAGTPQAIIDRLGAIMNKGLALPETIQRFEKNGLEVATTGTPRGFQDMIRSDLRKWIKLIKDAKITVDVLP